MERNEDHRPDMSEQKEHFSRRRLHLLALLSGLAALSWEVLWQIKASLALGVSAWGTAITLAATMGGMSVGSLAMGRYLRTRMIARPVVIYAGLEFMVALAGLLLVPGFAAVSMLDTRFFAADPANAPLIHILGIVAVLGVPTMCMGATIPVFGLIARQYRTSVATLYGLNTLGAAGGALVAAFALIPWAGVQHASWAVAGLNAAVAVAALLLPIAAVRDSTALTIPAPARQSASSFPPATQMLCVFVTGLATFMLEIAWFRALTAAFQSTTSAFAVMLSVMLLALGLAGWLTPALKRKNLPLGALVGAAGILILLATPLIERFDLLPYSEPPLIILDWFVRTLLVIGPPVALLGTALPWLLDDQETPRQWSRLYALNTVSAIAGALGAAWILLPAIGFAPTAWVAGGMVAAMGLAMGTPRRTLVGVCAVAALLIAMAAESGAGRTRVLGWTRIKDGKPPKAVLAYHEGPEASVAAVTYEDGANALIINGFVAATELSSSHYMRWMGYLPMLAHPDPKDALVICFGTGQTANAVRRENPATLDIVDINPWVPKLGHYFARNEDVLNDPRVRVTIMDGRAYMRRTTKMYDVITLEPMPPTFAGVNALYSREFYELAAQRLRPDGVIAQWLPFHLVAPYDGASIAATFAAVFPNSVLWIDAQSGTGILIGSKNPQLALGASWPGFGRAAAPHDLDEAGVKAAVKLMPDALARYARSGQVITDDNQQLAYGRAVSFIYGHNERKPNAMHRELMDSALHPQP